MVKICLCTDIYGAAGVGETAFQYSLAAKRKGIDFVISGFIENAAAKYLPIIDKSSPKFVEKGVAGKVYALNSENSKDVDLFVFFFDNGNFYDIDELPGALEKITRIVPKEKSIVIDSDGKYNPTMYGNNDCNHISKRAGRNWIKTFESLSDRIFQTTLKPSRENAESFVFWGYQEPKRKLKKRFDLLYLGSNWHKIDNIKKFMTHLDTIRNLYPRIAVSGKNWITQDSDWPKATIPDVNFFLERNIELKEQLTRFGEFTKTLSSSKYSPILIRPILSKMEIITPRMIETFASGTIPVLTNDFYYAKDLYGKESHKLKLGEVPVEKLTDMQINENEYVRIVKTIQSKLKAEHSYEQKLEQLLKIGGLK